MTVASVVVAEEVLYEAGGGVGRVTINRPERRNALAWSTVAALRTALARARDDSGVRVVVVTGAGEKAFCAGVDLRSVASGTSTPGEPAPAAVLDEHQGPGELAGLFLDLWSLGKPTVARVRGYALAGGFALAVACDLVVAAEDAVFAVPEIDVGLWPYVATVPLVRSMPHKTALELMMTGRRVDAVEASRIGFVNRLVPTGELDPATDELAATLASKPAGPLRQGRDAFYAVWDLGPREALAHLHPLLSLAMTTDEAREGAAAFAEKRPPRWSG